MMLVHAIAGIVWVFHSIRHGHPLAEVPWLGITGFVTAPYAINKGHAAIDAVADALGRKPA